MTRAMTCFASLGLGQVGLLEKLIPRAGPNDANIRTPVALIGTADVDTVAVEIGDRLGLTLGHKAVGVIHEFDKLAAASGLFKIGERFPFTIRNAGAKSLGWC